MATGGDQPSLDADVSLSLEGNLLITGDGSLIVSQPRHSYSAVVALSREAGGAPHVHVGNVCVREMCVFRFDKRATGPRNAVNGRCAFFATLASMFLIASGRRLGWRRSGIVRSNFLSLYLSLRRLTYICIIHKIGIIYRRYPALHRLHNSAAFV